MGVALLSAIETILAEIVTDSNAELDQLPEDFHYRGRLRDQTWSDKLAYKILATIKSSYPEGRLESIRSCTRKTSRPDNAVHRGRAVSASKIKERRTGCTHVHESVPILMDGSGKLPVDSSHSGTRPTLAW